MRTDSPASGTAIPSTGDATGLPEGESAPGAGIPSAEPDSTQPAESVGPVPGAAREGDAILPAAEKAVAACAVSESSVTNSEVYVPDAQADGAAQGRTRREWLLLGERVFSHPRYAVLIVLALALCAFERYTPVLASLAVFFTAELGLRFRLQKERGFASRAELGFLLLDSLATLSLLLAVFMPAGLAGSGMYLRLARLLRGMYMLRMLRIFRFLTYETMIYSVSYALSVLTLALLAVLIPEIALYAGVVLILEAACRAYAVLRTLEKSVRQRAELGFAVLDLLASGVLLGLIPGLAAGWVLMRALRYVVMLNPLGNLWQALHKVISIDEVRKETAMLAGVFVLLMALTAMAVLYLYPGMDLSGDDGMNTSDYAPWQVILYSFRFLLDPGNAPASAFSPMLALITMGIVLCGVFFFALFVGFGSNVMHYLLEQLANSPLSARETLLMAGWSKQALPVLKVFDQMCGRMRRSFATAWLFFGPVGSGAHSIGRWLSVRHVEAGERGIVSRFRLTGIRFTIFFQSRYSGWRDRNAIADMQALTRDGCISGNSTQASGVVVCDAALPADIMAVYRDSLGMQVLDSSSLKARMLYQMHHCALMPELGARMLNVVNGETGLYAVVWDATLQGDSAGSWMQHGTHRVLLEDWLSVCFGRGINLLAGRCQNGELLLFGDLRNLNEAVQLSDVVGIGRDPLLWQHVMKQAMSAQRTNPDAQGRAVLKDFVWPETWDISMIFLGWHDGLPAMIEEMAEKHHKLAVHVLFPGSEEDFIQRRMRLQESAVRASERTGCALQADVHSWYGFSADALMPYLKGCKVIMLYPEDGNGGEDSLLEMWFHEVARMLETRKAKVKWWTPPKLMVLPRDAANIPDLRDAASQYTRLEIDVGSPDSFHDVFISRQLLSQALYHSRPEHLRQDHIAYDFMQQVLGDAVIIEGVNASRLLAKPGAGWVDVYREAWRRGWMLIAYLLPRQAVGTHDMFGMLDNIFPAAGSDGNSRMHLLGGCPSVEMDAPLHAAILLFCRRGLLREQADAGGPLQAAEPLPTKALPENIETKVIPESADKQEGAPAVQIVQSIAAESAGEMAGCGTGDARIDREKSVRVEMLPQDLTPDETEQVHPEPEQPDAGLIEADVSDDVPFQKESRSSLAEIAKEGEIMHDSVWPRMADKRLIRVLKMQIEGALGLLNSSTEDGLIKLTDAMDRDVEGVLADDIMAALTDLQNIDRVMQRLKNVENCLNDWSAALGESSSGEALWKDEVEKRYVMEEERQVLRSEL